IPGRIAICNGKEYLFFSGTSYLGINSSIEFQEYLTEGISHYGTNYSSSRNSNFRLKVYEDAEHHLATFAGAESALTVSSGYMAGQLTVRYFMDKGEFIFAPNAHPAVCTQPSDFFYADFDHWVNNLHSAINNTTASSIIIVTNSLDPLLAVNYNFNWVSTLPADKNVTLIIDDSHGFGITGNNGSGIFSEINTPPHVNLIVVSSFGKAMGIPGGLVFSNKKTIDQLKKSAYFNTSSPIIPAYLYAYLKSDELFTKKRMMLHANVNHFHSIAGNSGLFQYFDHYPVFYTTQNKLYPFLEKKDILVSSFAYPMPGDDLITRVVINSHHTAADIEQLGRCIQEFPGR
ncbi:MAG TPA: aminotransferase class I/II-fold pyridoxal phosphate-dependent enzyme, partial [Agriterribacter sp.]|nr:aminotransferase class I/II-fold pyridoxal phosphate-dependent enzyme [Agriterribacter sp.]